MWQVDTRIPPNIFLLWLVINKSLTDTGINQSALRKGSVQDLYSTVNKQNSFLFLFFRAINMINKYDQLREGGNPNLFIDTHSTPSVFVLDIQMYYRTKYQILLLTVTIPYQCGYKWQNGISQQCFFLFVFYNDDFSFSFHLTRLCFGKRPEKNSSHLL